MGQSGQTQYAKGKVDGVKVGIVIIIFILIGFTIAYGSSPNEGTTENEQIVMATANNIAYFAEEMSGENIKVDSIVTPGECPGHYDTRASDVAKIAKADLILWNGFEVWVNDLIESSENPDVVLNKTPKGPWGPAWGAKMYIENIADAMASVYPQYESVIKEREDRLLSLVENCADNLKDTAKQENVGGTKVICPQVQKGFVKWLGFNVVETYPSPEDVSAGEISDLIGLAENEDVCMIISNNPSGTGVGVPVARDADVEHVVLSNFPGSREGEDTYFDMVRKNAERLFSAKENYETQD